MSGSTAVFAPRRGRPLPIDDAVYGRLLGYPPRHILEGMARQRAEEARRWLAEHGRPVAALRSGRIESIAGDAVTVAEGPTLASPRLADLCARGAAPEVVVAAVTAGPEVDRESAARWADDRPDEAWFLDRLGAATTEHLAAWAAGYLARRAARRSLAVFPNVSPGYDGWPLTDQRPLSAFLAAGLTGEAPCPVEALPSGMLLPKSSLLAVFVLTADLRLAAGLQTGTRCNWCSMSPCAFRRGRGLGAE